MGGWAECQGKFGDQFSVGMHMHIIQSPPIGNKLDHSTETRFLSRCSRSSSLSLIGGWYGGGPSVPVVSFRPHGHHMTDFGMKSLNSINRRTCKVPSHYSTALHSPRTTRTVVCPALLGILHSCRDDRGETCSLVHTYPGRCRRRSLWRLH